MQARSLAPAILLLFICNPLVAAETGGHLTVTVAPGYDTNPLELPGNESSGMFTQFVLDTGLAVQLNGMSGFFIDADGATRYYEADLEDGDRSWVNLRSGFLLSPYRNGSRSFSLAVGGTFSAYRSTYIDPATGEAFAVFDPVTNVPVPGRFDFNATGLFLDTRFRLTPRLLLYMNTALEQRRYVEDYSDLTTLEPLDDQTISVNPGVRFQVSDRVGFDISADRYVRDYDKLSALDESALQVPGETRSYEGVTLKVAAFFAPVPDLNLVIGVRSSVRDDRYAGYYDYGGAGAFLSVDYSPWEKTGLELYTSLQDIGYDNATIDNTLNGDTRDSERLLVIGRVTHDISSHFSFFVEGGLDSSENKDPLYTFDRNWGMTGFSFHL